MVLEGGDLADRKLDAGLGNVSEECGMNSGQTHSANVAPPVSRLFDDGIDLCTDAGRGSIHCGTAKRLQRGDAGILVRDHRTVNTRCLKAPENFGLHQQDRVQLFFGCGHVVSLSVRSVGTLTVTTDRVALYCTQVDQQMVVAETSRGSTP